VERLVDRDFLDEALREDADFFAALLREEVDFFTAVRFFVAVALAGFTFTPDRRALDRPIATACFRDFTREPRFPSL
jgi:hypothetical protein